MRMVDVERAMGAPGTCAPRSLCDFALLLMLSPAPDYLTGHIIASIVTTCLLGTDAMYVRSGGVKGVHGLIIIGIGSNLPSTIHFR